MSAILRSTRRPINPRSLTSYPACSFIPRRNVLTLAIKTSCDDTAVAILEKHDASTTAAGQPLATLHFNEKITANNAAYRGVHPIVSLESHQENLALLIQKALKHLPDAQPPATPAAAAAAMKPTTTTRTVSPALPIILADTGAAKQRPDFVSVARGPGMRSNLSTGLDTAKGLATAWQIPLVGVHHMQAHALTPRLVSALQPASPASSASPSAASASASGDFKDKREPSSPAFPFLSLLVSGGHTLLLHSQSLTAHKALAETADTAVGDAIDKIARAVLPDTWLHGARDTMYGALLETFAFPATPESASPHHDHDHAYTPTPTPRRSPTPYGWSFAPPLAESKGGRRARDMQFSFSGLVSSAERFAAFRWDPSAPEGQRNTRIPRGDGELREDERRAMAREAMRVAFEHLASRVCMALRHLQDGEAGGESGGRAEGQQRRPKALVVSGGVAANRFLRHVLRACLDAQGFGGVRLVFPPPKLCTDNAAMIAWAGVEMWEEGWRSGWNVRAIRKWSLDPEAEDGGVLGVGGWVRRER